MKRSNNLREIRKELGMTQIDVVLEVRNGGRHSVSEPHYRKLEKGIAAPSVYLAMAIARALGTDVYEIWP